MQKEAEGRPNKRNSVEGRERDPRQLCTLDDDIFEANNVFDRLNTYRCEIRPSQHIPLYRRYALCAFKL